MLLAICLFLVVLALVLEGALLWITRGSDIWDRNG